MKQDFDRLQRFGDLPSTAAVKEGGSVLYLDGTYYCYFLARPAPAMPQNIVRAVSADRIFWHDATVVDLRTSGSVTACTTLLRGGKIALLYAVRTPFGTRLHLAKSSDGLHFDPHPEPVLSAHFDLREPRLFYAEKRYFLLGAIRRPFRSEIVLLESRNLMKWESVGTIRESRGRKPVRFSHPSAFTCNAQSVLLYRKDVRSDEALAERGDFDLTRADFSAANASVLYGIRAPRTSTVAGGETLLTTPTDIGNGLVVSALTAPNDALTLTYPSCLERRRAHDGKTISLSPGTEATLHTDRPTELSLSIDCPSGSVVTLEAPGFRFDFDRDAAAVIVTCGKTERRFPLSSGVSRVDALILPASAAFYFDGKALFSTARPPRALTLGGTGSVRADLYTLEE